MTELTAHLTDLSNVALKKLEEKIEKELHKRFQEGDTIEEKLDSAILKETKKEQRWDDKVDAAARAIQGRNLQPLEDNNLEIKMPCHPIDGGKLIQQILPNKKLVANEKLKEAKQSTDDKISPHPVTELMSKVLRAMDPDMQREDKIDAANLARGYKELEKAKEFLPKKSMVINAKQGEDTLNSPTYHIEPASFSKSVTPLMKPSTKKPAEAVTPLVTKEQVKVALAAFIKKRNGIDEAGKLLESFGASRLSDLNPAYYYEFHTQVTAKTEAL